MGGNAPQEPVPAAVVVVALALVGIATLEPRLLQGALVALGVFLAMIAIVLIAISGAVIALRRAFGGLGLTPIDPFRHDPS